MTHGMNTPLKKRWKSGHRNGNERISASQINAAISHITDDNIRCARRVVVEHFRRAIIVQELFDHTFSDDYNYASRESIGGMIAKVYRHSLGCMTCCSRRPTRREGRRLTFQEVTGWFYDNEFRLAFRMSRSTFMKLVECLKHDLVKDEAMGRLSSDGCISAQVRVGIVLRLFSGAGVADMMLLFHVSDSSVYQFVKDVVRAVIRNMDLPGIPTDPEECRQFAEWMTFSRRIANPFHGCIFAVDGIAIKIDKPEDRDMPREYQCRKGFFALPLIAAVDGKYRFLCFSLRCPGSTHDSLAFDISNLNQFLRAGKLPIEVFGVADEAFINTEYLLVPIPVNTINYSVFDDAYNFFISSFRIHVEQAFGMLVVRWNVLRAGLRYSLANTFNTVHAMLLLHNFCVESSDYFGHPLSSDPGDSEREERWKEWVDLSTAVFDEISARNTLSSETTTAIGSTVRRTYMVSELRRRGITRPSIR